MSDFRDPGKAGGSGEEKGSLLNREWQYPESDSPEATESINRQSGFEGASSMIELSNQLTAEDGNLTSASEQNLRKLLEDVEEVRKASQASPEGRLEPESPYLNRFLERARALYANQELKACLEILHEGLKLAPGNPEVLSLTQKARRASELRQAKLEESDLTDRIAQCKAEAIKLFEQGRYTDCVERFKLLSELEPENSDLRDYLEISQEQVEKQQSSQLNLPVIVPLENQNTAVPTLTPDAPAPALVSHAEPVPPSVLTEPETRDSPEILSVQPFSPLPPIPGDSVAEAIPELTSKPRANISGHPATTQVEEIPSQDLTAVHKETGPKPATEETAGTPEDTVQLRAKKLKIVCLAGAGLVIGAVFGTWLALRQPGHPSLPEVPVQPDSSQVAVNPPQVPLDLSAPAEVDLQTQAEKAFKQGRLLEANRFCETMLATEPDNNFALSLKQEIRERFSNLGTQAMANQRWEEGAVAWNNVLRVFPNDREAVRQVKAARASLKKQEQMALAGRLESEKRIQELHQGILQAISSGRYLPPNSGNALELIQQLESLSPDNAFGREKLDQIFRDLMALANRTLQAKDTARASSLVRQIQTHFPETPELKVLRENIKAEELRLTEARNSWLQRVETAMTAGHYVTPANDNAVAYCNQLLALEPQNVKALELRKEGTAKAGAQAKALVQEGKYDDARAIYSSLLYLPQNESQMPLNSQQLKAEVERLTFGAYPVVHDHAFGSCTGRLRFNSYQISFVPSSDSKDGFAVKISEVVQVESGDKLKIHFKGKTYRFQPNAKNNPQESRAGISDIHQRLSALIASSK